MRWLVAQRRLAACCLLVGLLPAGCAEELTVLSPGDDAPGFKLEALEGGFVSLEEFAGRYVLVRFWADWCKSCRIEMPLIDEKYRQFKDDGLTVLAVNVRQGRDVAEKFVKGVGISYPVLLDSDGRAARAFGVIGLPSTFLVSRDGKVLEEVIGDMNRKSLSALIDPLFGERKSAEENRTP